VVGAVNILSRHLHGEVGRVQSPEVARYRHPIQSGKRSSLDTGQPAMAVACGLPQEAARL
jgi:hypothetical protein